MKFWNKVGVNLRKNNFKTMKKIFLILMICPFLYLKAQMGNFGDGYQRGWKEGYCHNYNASPTCIPPIPPISPIPLIGEDIDNYKDGYNRGFADGLESFNNSNINLNFNNNDRERYQTSSPEYVDFMYKPNWDLMIKVIQLADKKREELIQKASREIENSDLENEDKQTIFNNINENCLKSGSLNSLYDCLKSQIDNQLEIIKRREARDEIRKHSTEEKQEESKKNDIKYYEKIYTGDVKVNSYAPIHKEPDMLSEEIYRVPFNNKVSIIERVKDGKYYRVKSNGKEGYIWTGFIIE